ncbi:MAG: flavodoxin family protein [Bacteroidota bacterium]
MKVIALNGSPKVHGNTYHAIKIVVDELEKEGISTEIVHVNQILSGCTGCSQCYKNKDEKCTRPDDQVNELIQKMKEADGIILGSPVHYAGICATFKCFLDRAFYVSTANNNLFRHKVGASLVAVRRSGGVTTFEQLNNYLNYSEMLMPTSNYWNVIHGALPGEALQDEEGVQIMRVLGENMAWALKLVENGKSTVKEPTREDKIKMNFIR